MPLPWKKAKCTRISQLVSDHLHSPKRGGSLVVETGFPTSLIDLFVKNRDRLKKPSKKKRPEVSTPPDPISVPPRPSRTFVVSPSSSTLATPSSTRPPNTPQVLLSPRGSPSATPQRCSSGPCRNEIGVVHEVGLVGDGRGKGNGECADANRVFIAILKMFFVVVLALGTKKLVVGITMSAFLLLFLEYAGKHLCRLVKPCAYAQKLLPCLIGRVLCFVGIKRHKLMMEEDKGFKAPIVQEETTPVVSVCSSLIEGHNLNDPIQDIQVLPPNSNSDSSKLIKGHKMNDLIREIQIAPPSPSLLPRPPAPEIRCVKYEFDLRSGKEKWASKEMGKKEEIFEKEEAYTSDAFEVKSRITRGKIRSKIKKLVTRKLHGSKKKRLELKNEASSSCGDQKVNMCEERQHVEDGQQCELEFDDNSSLSSERNGDPVNVDAICCSREFSRPEIESSVVREHLRRETERNSGYLIIFVILLVGLVGGRVVALALTLSWYLLLKAAGPLQRCLNL